MRIFLRVLVVAALVWLGVVIFIDARAQQAVENPDHSKIMVAFAGIILVALVTGCIVALSVIPALGDWVAGLLVSPTEEIAHDPHTDAQARIAQGDYEGAIAVFLGIYGHDPSDVHALSEAGRLYVEKFHDPERAAGLFEDALQGERTHEEVAFLANRLVDIYWLQQNDAERSCALLAQIVESLPGTKHSANAQHRIHEIERAAASGHLPLPPAEEES